MPKGIPRSGTRKGYRLKRDSTGKLVRINGASWNNAKPARFYVRYGGSADLLNARIDMRSSLGQRYKRDSKAYIAHLGGSATATQAAIVDQAIRVGMLRDMAWSALMQTKSPVRDDGKIEPSADLFLKACKQQREALSLLGLERRARDISLQDVLEGRVSRETA